MEFLRPRKKKHDPRSELAKKLHLQEGEFINSKYFSKDVPLPPDFLSLTSPPPDARPITFTPIDWAKTDVPENKERYAAVMDNLLSPSECEALLRLAESSVDIPRLNDFWKTPGEETPWRPAMVSAGNGLEVLHSDYRNSERLIWDSQEVADRLWARCLQGEIGDTIRQRLETLVWPADEVILGNPRGRKRLEHPPQKWQMHKLNPRMRFLKYEPGQFFRREYSLPFELCVEEQRLTPSYAAHCDSNYSEEEDGRVLKTFFTIHLYLNDSVAEAGKQAGLVGGATSFLSNDGIRKTDVNPKAGRALIFQQRSLDHAGDDVVKGTKYTMRTEIMYELIREEQSEI